MIQYLISADQFYAFSVFLILIFSKNRKKKNISFIDYAILVQEISEA
jgi:hypothetical protein